MKRGIGLGALLLIWGTRAWGIEMMSPSWDESVRVGVACWAVWTVSTGKGIVEEERELEAEVYDFGPDGEVPPWDRKIWDEQEIWLGEYPQGWHFFRPGEGGVVLRWVVEDAGGVTKVEIKDGEEEEVLGIWEAPGGKRQRVEGECFVGQRIHLRMRVEREGGPRLGLGIGVPQLWEAYVLPFEDRFQPYRGQECPLGARCPYRPDGLGKGGNPLHFPGKGKFLESTSIGCAWVGVRNDSPLPMPVTPWLRVHSREGEDPFSSLLDEAMFWFCLRFGQPLLWIRRWEEGTPNLAGEGFQEEVEGMPEQAMREVREALEALRKEKERRMTPFEPVIYQVPPYSEGIVHWILTLEGWIGEAAVFPLWMGYIKGNAILVQGLMALVIRPRPGGSMEPCRNLSQELIIRLVDPQGNPVEAGATFTCQPWTTPRPPMPMGKQGWMLLPREGYRGHFGKGYEWTIEVVDLRWQGKKTIRLPLPGDEPVPVDIPVFPKP